jgi:uncharacterized protein YdhG (YjbR/CyaY superfamily)
MGIRPSFSNSRLKYAQSLSGRVKMARTGSGPKNVEEYLEDVTPDEKRVLERMRRTIRKACPKAEEVMSYGMPAYKYHGMLAWFTAHENHCGLYVRPGNVKALEKELEPYRSSKSTIRFTVKRPLPDRLVAKIIKESAHANMEREKEKKSAKKTRSR